MIKNNRKQHQQKKKQKIAKKPSAEVVQLLVSQVMTSAQVVQRVSHYEKQSFSELYPTRTNIVQSTKQ